MKKITLTIGTFLISISALAAQRIQLPLQDDAQSFLMAQSQVQELLQKVHLVAECGDNTFDIADSVERMVGIHFAIEKNSDESVNILYQWDCDGSHNIIGVQAKIRYKKDEPMTLLEYKTFISDRHPEWVREKLKPNVTYEEAEKLLAPPSIFDQLLGTAPETQNKQILGLVDLGASIKKEMVMNHLFFCF